MTRNEILNEIQRQRGLALDARKQLAESDYKVLKCAEAVLSKVEPPYDVDELVAVRSELRRVVNHAEEAIGALMRTEPEGEEEHEVIAMQSEDE